MRLLFAIGRTGTALLHTNQGLDVGLCGPSVCLASFQAEPSPLPRTFAVALDRGTFVKQCCHDGNTTHLETWATLESHSTNARIGDPRFGRSTLRSYAGQKADAVCFPSPCLFFCR
jgi:hypothetical protein